MRSAHLPYAEHGAADSYDQKYNASGRGKLPNACLVELRDDLKNSGLTRHKISDRWRERAWLRVNYGSH